LQGEKRAFEFEFTDGNTGGLLKHVGEFDGGMNRPRGLEESLKAYDLFGERKAGVIQCVGLLRGGHEFG
jgi:hypothetical protein